MNKILFSFVKNKIIDCSVPLYKNTHLDIDVNSKSDRIEWGHARYQCTWRPYTAYEMCIQWLTASGNIVADLVCNPFWFLFPNIYFNIILINSSF